MGLSSFVKKLYLFGVIFGGRGKKIAGISDSANNISSTEVIWDNATKTITFVNETSLPTWLTPGKFFRTYDGVPKTTPSSTDINYIPNVILTPNPLTNDGVLFQVLSVSGNIITVDDSGSGATPADRDTTGLPTIITLEGRIAIVVNDANICRINGSGSTVYNIENQTPSAVPGDGSGVAAAFADHFHAALGSSSSFYLGWYVDDAALIAAHPVGIDGNYANVGSTDTMWIWDSDTNAWVDSGILPPPSVVVKELTSTSPTYVLPPSPTGNAIYKIFCKDITGFTARVQVFAFGAEFIVFPTNSYKNGGSYTGGQGIYEYIFERPGCLTITRNPTGAPGYAVLSEEFDRDNYLEVKDNMFNCLSNEWVPYATNIGTAEFVSADHGFKLTTDAAVGGSLMGYSWGDNYIKDLSFKPVMDVLLYTHDISDTKIRLGFKNFLGDYIMAEMDIANGGPTVLSTRSGGSEIMAYSTSPMLLGFIRLTIQVTGDYVFLKVNNQQECALPLSSVGVPTSTPMTPFFEVESTSGAPVTATFLEIKTGQELLQ